MKSIALKLTQREFDLLQSLLCEECRRSNATDEGLEHAEFCIGLLEDMHDAETEHCTP